MATTGLVGKTRIAEINVTPMADVIIVLLIIFMVTLPAIDEGPVRRLPEAVHTGTKERGPLVVSVSADASVFVGGSKLATHEELRKHLRNALEGARERLVLLRADPSLNYAEVGRVLEACRQAGAEEVAFIAAPHLGS